MSRSLAARRLSGQAIRLIFTFLHGTLAVAMTAALIGGVGAGALAWRLARGPLDLPWLAARIAAAADPALAPARLRIGRAELAWEGFNSGMAAPIDLRLRDMAVLGANGVAQAAVPRAAVTLSIPALLRLRLAPRDVVLSGPVLVLRRAPDGRIGLAVGAAEGPAAPTPLNPAAILGELARPPAGLRNPLRFGLLSQLRRLEIRDAELVLEDPGLGTV
ncbi:MAG: hypothetical protein KGI51_03090, partial [Rhodospirillales bacterium]|nr:hypothetical protein [Rhodospirillales bacterium]